jgi:pimeloyl-ACP methyl ester carboxylesterase
VVEVVPVGEGVSQLPTFSVTLHGGDVHYVKVGRGPVLVLIHGILGSRRDWEQLVSLLQRDFTVIAPDLLGHGDSATPRGDYTLGGHAGRLRDLLDLLGVRRATLVGHSLGGGVAMQFAWLFPERCERLVLVSSGGLGRDLSRILWAPTLPGAEWVLPLISAPWLLRRGELLAGTDARPARPAVRARSPGAVARLRQPGRRRGAACLPGHHPHGGRPRRADGQRAGAAAGADWHSHPAGLGARDRLIPVAHGVAARQAIPGSRLEVFEQAGHSPHLSDPPRFAALLREFVATTPTPAGDRAGGRRRRRQGPTRPVASG